MEETLSYCARPALQAVVAEALESLGLESRPEDIRAMPGAAPTFAEQWARIARRSNVFALVRQRVPVSEDDRQTVYRLVDAASRRLEGGERPPPASALMQPTIAEVEAYANAGGGCCGRFAEWLAARRGITPLPPATDPRPRPPGPRAPRSPMPPKSNPTRTIRSRRWDPAGKAVKS